MNENKLGTVLSELRKEKGITQKDLAEALNISDKAISRWECGTSRPTLEMMFQISKYFKISYNDLITARISDDHEDDKIVEEIVKEFSDLGKKKVKRIKFVLLFSVILILILTIAIIFTNTYNRFKVYKVHSESSEINYIKGLYVETNIRDTLYLGDIRIKDVTIKEDDTVSVDIFIKNGDKEEILQNYSSLDSIFLVGSQSYVEIDNLSKYFDNMYLRVTIIDSKNKVKEYETKLDFALDFSNNKVIYNDNFNTKEITYELKMYNSSEIKEILLENGFKEINSDNLRLTINNYKFLYSVSSNILSVNYEQNNLSYQYRFSINNEILDVIVFDENSTEVENYNYDVKNNKMNCNVGKCNNYKKVLELLDEKVLYLLK